jgi:hypothetical protein
MITQQPFTRMQHFGRPSILLERRSTASDRLGRLSQIALALYLVPVLLVVLVVGGLGMLIFGCVRLLKGPVQAPLG